jgi:beta-lactamase class A
LSAQISSSDSTGNPLAVVNPNRSFLSASTYKVLVMYCVYQQFASGALSPETPVTIDDSDATEGADGWLSAGETVTVSSALDLMIAVSSNTAAHALVRTVGGWGAVTAAAAGLGMSGTTLDSEGWFTTTPADMSTFFTALAQGQLVSASASGEMISLLAAQTTNDRLPADLPAGTVVAHKTGELTGIRHDVGIVYAPGGPVIVCALSEGSPVETVPAIAHVSRLVYDYYSAP